MLKHRIIPVLLWDGKTAVQTTKFSDIRPVGSMEQHIETMESRNIDELIILDIAATKENREPNFELIKRYAGRLFCPVTYGGGIHSIDCTKRLIQECGVDKIAVNTKFNLIEQISKVFGSQAVVFSVDDYFGFGIGTYLSSIFMAKLAQQDGAGEILITDVTKNGTQVGYNQNLLRQALYRLKVPIIINGGCGSPEHMLKAINNGANSVAASTMFLFTEHTPRSCARALREAGLPVRVDG